MKILQKNFAFHFEKKFRFLLKHRLVLLVVLLLMFLFLIFVYVNHIISRDEQEKVASNKTLIQLLFVCCWCYCCCNTCCFCCLSCLCLYIYLFILIASDLYQIDLIPIFIIGLRWIAVHTYKISNCILSVYKLFTLIINKKKKKESWTN